MTVADPPAARPGAASTRRPKLRAADRVRAWRALSATTIVAFCWCWLARTTGTVPWAALVVVAGLVGSAAVVGTRTTALVRGALPWASGFALDFVVGWFVVNTLLFVLTLASPLGIAVHAAIVAIATLVVATVVPIRRRSTGSVDPSPDPLKAEHASLAVVVLIGVIATIWVGDAQPIAKSNGDSVVFTVWQDVFIHARLISAFAHAHGLSTLSDIKLAGVHAAVYHFAGYVVPAALTAIGGLRAMDAFAAFQLPFGILIAGLGAYVLVAGVCRVLWPAVVAAVVVMGAPDAFQQGFGLRYLSFHFMSQVNLGMLYGLACIALAWLFLIEACRRDRWPGVVVAYALLATCVAYKAHLFVANALPMMLYPCLAFGRFRWPLRIGASAAVVAIYAAALSLAARSPRVPTLRYDGSGFRPYAAVLRAGFGDGWWKRAFDALYLIPTLPTAANAALVGVMLLVGSFGLWLVVAPLALHRVRRALPAQTLGFVAVVAVNYVAMSTLLAIDEHAVGAPEELLNRPHAWAYFVVASFGAAAVAIAVARRWPTRRRALAATGLVAVVLAVASAIRFAPDAETFPEWGGYETYATFNAEPACEVALADAVRRSSPPDAVLQDSRLDPKLVVTALAERQAYVADATFGGAVDEVGRRKAALASARATPGLPSLAAWAAAHRVDWYLMHPGDDAGWPAADLDRAARRCGDFRLFRLGDATMAGTAAMRR